MAKKTNEFTGDVQAFLDLIVDLRHLLVFVPWLHEMAEPTVKKSNEILQKHGAPPNSVGPATGSSVINIFHDGEYVTRAPAGKRVTQGKDVERMAGEVEGRMLASLLCVLHESWEVYVKNLYGKMLFQIRDGVSLPSREAFHKSKPNWRDYNKTENYFVDYAAFACRRDCSEALKLLRDQLDWDLVHVKIWVWGNMEWMDVAKVLAFCRHSIVHDEGRVSEKRMEKLNKPLREYVAAMMKNTILSDEKRILPEESQLDRLMEAMASFAYGLYVLSSKRCGMEQGFDLFAKPKATGV